MFMNLKVSFLISNLIHSNIITVTLKNVYIIDSFSFLNQSAKILGQPRK